MKSTLSLIVLSAFTIVQKVTCMTTDVFTIADVYGTVLERQTKQKTINNHTDSFTYTVSKDFVFPIFTIQLCLNTVLSKSSATCYCIIKTQRNETLFDIDTPQSLINWFKTNAYNEQSLLTMLGLSKTIDLENNTLTRGILGKEFKYKNNADDQIPISNAILQHNENIKKLKPEDFLELLYKNELTKDKKLAKLHTLLTDIKKTQSVAYPLFAVLFEATIINNAVFDQEIICESINDIIKQLESDNVTAKLNNLGYKLLCNKMNELRNQKITTDLNSHATPKDSNNSVGQFASINLNNIDIFDISKDDVQNYIGIKKNSSTLKRYVFWIIPFLIVLYYIKQTTLHI